MCWFSGPLRGRARSHRYSAQAKHCAVLVGAGVPAKKARRCQRPWHASTRNQRSSSLKPCTSMNEITR
ncbi:hypothetical protein CXB65_24310 [Pseudomonas monteilii]|uniref:Uncharacterized protein n=1 Tax=Pseudomonas monteilii TaxID=76759 RepID=A0A2N1ILA4_9PSED|nr:hypothetical protein CXB65_24310 [Pseudomonas monteilii]RPD91453.1 hypothetical protein EGN69_26320 [Pseudomonas monteilii]TFW25353.1 hypothetical protein E4L40_05540 [Pseudomonas putida]